jgi:hypothetical protein
LSWAFLHVIGRLPLASDDASSSGVGAVGAIARRGACQLHHACTRPLVRLRFLDARVVALREAVGSLACGVTGDRSKASLKYWSSTRAADLRTHVRSVLSVSNVTALVSGSQRNSNVRAQKLARAGSEFGCEEFGRVRPYAPTVPIIGCPPRASSVS